MATTENLRVGVTKNFEGYYEETKSIALPVFDVNEDPVDLTGSTITMKTRPSSPTATVTNYSMPDDVLTGIDEHKILLDLTPFLKKWVNHEIKVVMPSGFTFFIDGYINLTDRI